MMKNRNVSVAMTTYNGEKYVSCQIDSLLRQTTPPYEIVVVDDCSTDGTMAILREYERCYPQIIKVYQNEHNCGPRNTFRKAFSLTTGDVIAPCDQDDVWFEDKLERCVAELNEEVKIVFHQDRIWYEDNSTEDTHHPTYTLNEILYSPITTGHTAVFDREVLKVYDWVDFICFDWALVLWGVGSGTYKQIDYVGCLWRRHKQALTTTVSHGYSTYTPRRMNKWLKVVLAMAQMMNGTHSNCIEKDAHDQEIILSHFVADNPKLKPYIKLARCYQKQTILAMIYAGMLSVKCNGTMADGVNHSLRDRIARELWAFRKPFVWWLDLHEYLESIDCM